MTDRRLEPPKSSQSCPACHECRACPKLPDSRLLYDRLQRTALGFVLLPREYNHANFTLHNRRRRPHACRRRPHGLRPPDPNQERCGITSQSVKDMNALSVSRHVCGHHCVRSSTGKSCRLIKPLHFLCYACRNLPGTELCRFCKVRGEWLDRHEINR